MPGAGSPLDRRQRVLDAFFRARVALVGEIVRCDRFVAAVRHVHEIQHDGDRGSEERVRRLAYLKRQRRALVDAEKKRSAVAEKLETCALALQSMRYDMMRLSASPQMHQHITSLANKALSLAEDVDVAVLVGDEMGRVGSARTSGARRAT